MASPEFDGAALRRIRAERGISQKRLAKAVGCWHTTISSYETGRAEPSVATLAAVALALNVSMDAFIRLEVAA